eukprot:gene16484-biopygen17262
MRGGGLRIAAPQAPPQDETSGIVAPQAPPGLATGLHRTYHIAMQDTSLRWHSTLGLVSHLMGLTAGGLGFQSQMAGKCTNGADTTKLNDTMRKNVTQWETVLKASGEWDLALGIQKKPGN